MSTTRYSRFEVTCDDCNVVSISVEPAHTIRAARAEAAAHGWEHDYRHKDVCPACVAARRAARLQRYKGDGRYASGEEPMLGDSVRAVNGKQKRPAFVLDVNPRADGRIVVKGEAAEYETLTAPKWYALVTRAATE